MGLRQERQARQALRRCRRDRREVIATSRAQKTPSQPGHRHYWAKQITSGSGARARARKFAVGMEDVVLKRDLQMRHSVGSGELCLQPTTPNCPATPRPRLPRDNVETSRVAVRNLAKYKQVRLFVGQWRPSPVSLSTCSSAGDKECVRLKSTWWRRFYEPDMSAVPMPSRGGKSLASLVTIW